MRIEDPEQFSLQSNVHGLANRAVLSRQAVHRAASLNSEHYGKLEKNHQELMVQLETAKKALRDLLVSRQTMSS